MIIGFDTAWAANVQKKGVASSEFHLKFIQSKENCSISFPLPYSQEDPLQLCSSSPLQSEAN